MPFEAPWNAVSQWLGVQDDADLDKILPNRKSFPDYMLLNATYIFHENKSQDLQEESCEDEGSLVSCIPIDTDHTEYYEDTI